MVKAEIPHIATTVLHTYQQPFLLHLSLVVSACLKLGSRHPYCTHRPLRFQKHLAMLPRFAALQILTDKNRRLIARTYIKLRIVALMVSLPESLTKKNRNLPQRGDEKIRSPNTRGTSTSVLPMGKVYQ